MDLKIVHEFEKRVLISRNHHEFNMFINFKKSFKFKNMFMNCIKCFSDFRKCSNFKKNASSERHDHVDMLAVSWAGGALATTPILVLRRLRRTSRCVQLYFFMPWNLRGYDFIALMKRGTPAMATSAHEEDGGFPYSVDYVSFVFLKFLVMLMFD